MLCESFTIIALTTGKRPHGSVSAHSGHHGAGGFYGCRFLHHLWGEGSREEMFHLQNGKYSRMLCMLNTFVINIHNTYIKSILNMCFLKRQFINQFDFFFR